MKITGPYVRNPRSSLSQSADQLIRICFCLNSHFVYVFSSLPSGPWDIPKRRGVDTGRKSSGTMKLADWTIQCGEISKIVCVRVCVCVEGQLNRHTLLSHRCYNHHLSDGSQPDSKDPRKMPIIWGNASNVVLEQGRWRLTGEGKLDWNFLECGRGPNHLS